MLANCHPNMFFPILFLLVHSLIPASGLLVGLAALSAYSFFLIGRICHATGASSLGEAWEKEVGTRSSWIVSAACFSCAFGSAITYSILLGDAFASLATTAGLKVRRSRDSRHVVL